ncbi:hypothetical protein D3C71_2182830 [compost metagenome]
MQAGHQNVPVGENVDFARHGLVTALELPDNATVYAKCEIRRAVFQQSSEAKAAAIWHADGGRHQHATIGIHLHAVGNA